MALTSAATTGLGPRISADTATHGQDLTVLRSKLDFSSANVGVVRGVDSGITASEDELELEGQIMIDRDASVATLTVRSGNTFYQFLSDGAATI